MTQIPNLCRTVDLFMYLLLLIYVVELRWLGIRWINKHDNGAQLNDNSVAFRSGYCLVPAYFYWQALQRQR